MKKIFVVLLCVFAGFIAPAQADPDTYDLLMFEYSSGYWDSYFQEVKSSELALPECSAMWEVYLMLKPLGANWVNAISSTAAAGDPTTILVSDAINFCANQFGTQRDTMEKVCPCSACQADSVEDAQLRAARGCAMLLTSVAGDNELDNPFVDFMWMMAEALDTGRDLSEGDAQQYFCRAEFDGWNSEFWYTLDYGLESCQMNVVNACGLLAPNCERMTRPFLVRITAGHLPVARHVHIV